MKRRSFLLGAAASILGERIANAAFGIFQTYAPAASSFNPVIVATESNVFGMDRSDPTQYLVPGNGNPAISTSNYYYCAGLYNFRPYDLDLMGSVGAAVKAANGGRRYVWVCTADHPVFGYACSTGEQDSDKKYPHPHPLPHVALGFNPARRRLVQSRAEQVVLGVRSPFDRCLREIVRALGDFRFLRPAHGPFGSCRYERGVCPPKLSTIQGSDVKALLGWVGFALDLFIPDKFWV